MWALLDDSDNITEIIAHPKSLVIDNIRHPKALFSAWTDAERKAIGIVPVTTTGNHLDIKYYIEVDEAFAVAEDGNSVIRTIGVKAKDRALEDVNEVDEDGEPYLDVDGIQVITRGLKYNAIQKVKKQQGSFLTSTDWYIIRKADNGTAIPSAIQTWRDAIRADATRIENAITAVLTMDQFIALHENTYNEDETVNTIATINSWTKK
jgi:hypothetical protein